MKWIDLKILLNSFCSSLKKTYNYLSNIFVQNYKEKSDSMPLHASSISGNDIGEIKTSHTLMFIIYMDVLIGPITYR